MDDIADIAAARSRAELHRWLADPRVTSRPDIAEAIRAALDAGEDSPEWIEAERLLGLASLDGAS